jgi:hypothetical protein
MFRAAAILTALGAFAIASADAAEGLQNVYGRAGASLNGDELFAAPPTGSLAPHINESCHDRWCWGDALFMALLDLVGRLS